MHPLGLCLQPLIAVVVLPELLLEFYFHASSGLDKVHTTKITRENMPGLWLMLKH